MSEERNLSERRQEARPGADPSEGEENYDTALKPLLWLLVPFVLLILYGMFN